MNRAHRVCPVLGINFICGLPREFITNISDCNLGAFAGKQASLSRTLSTRSSGNQRYLAL
jgi:hypothetical protein